jgi:glyoxylase-like metal-dependent hydrolase (beta-lactamase superfamily II)
MNTWTIRPIALAETTLDKSAITYRANFGVPYTQCTYIWYLEGGNQRIIVDAGVDSNYLVKKRRIPSKDTQSVIAGLNEFGVGPDDVDLVIVTHLHSDHIAHGRQFRNAKFLIQRTELEFAHNPHPTVAPQYPREFFEGLRFEVIEGDTEVCPGISVLHTPGHTTGGQSVSIATDKGVAVIAGLCTIRENFEPARGKESVVPCGVFVNLFETYDSLLRIKQTADIVIPLHDPEYRDTKRIP